MEPQGSRGNHPKKIVVDATTDAGLLLDSYNSLDAVSQAHLLGYALGLKKSTEDKVKKNSKTGK